MGRLSALSTLLLATAALAACEQKEEPTAAPKSRAAAIQATAPASQAAPATTPEPEPPKPKRVFCEGQLEGAGRDLPDEKLGTAGEPKPSDAIPVGNGKWTWLNFWAAWCVPCKEEIPRLKSWEQRLGDRMRLVFVSLDDDERQLHAFMAAQPEGGLKATYWLREGKGREEWLTEAGLEADPELPAHVLVDPKGKVRCATTGAVDDRDYERVAEIIGE